MDCTEICKDVLVRVLSQFSTQDPQLVFNEINNQFDNKEERTSFLKGHEQAIIFYKAYTCVRDEIVVPYANRSRPWDPDNSYLVRFAHQMIVRKLKNDLRTLTSDLDIEFITAISGEKQEKRSVRDACIVAVPYEHYINMGEEVILRFEENNRRELCIPQAHAVRKQLDLTKDGCLVVCKQPGCQQYKTFGVINTEVAKRYPRFKLNSYLCWSFCMPGLTACENTVLQYYRGSLMMPTINLAEAHRRDLNNHLKNLNTILSDAETGYAVKLVQALTKCEHGGIIILSRSKDIKDQAERLVEKNRGMKLSEPISMNLENGEPDVSMISRLSSIDGAILIDFEGKCYAYGVILDGVVIRDGNPDRGSRFNSTKTYIENRVCDDNGEFDKTRPPFLGIVFSDDGMVNIRCGQKEDVGLSNVIKREEEVLVGQR